MHLHRLALRSGAALLAALLIAASLGSATVGAQDRAAGRTAASPDRTTSAARVAALKHATRISGTHRSFQARPAVNARRLARHPSSGRSTGTLPLLTRTPATKPGSGKPRAVAAVAPPPANATTNGDPAVALAPFDGLSSATSPDTAGEPPDPWVAVGPDHIVQADNLVFRMTDRQGADPLDVSMFDFFGLSSGMGNSDPHVIYDSLHGRWIATEVSWDCDTSDPSVNFGHGYLDLAVSETTDPTGFWDVGGFIYNDQLPDYPGPGTSSDKIGLASNVFDMTAGPDCVDGATLAFDSGDVLFMDWTDLLNGGTFAVDEWFNPHWFTPRMAVEVPATNPTLQMVVAYDQGGGETNVAYLTYTGSVAGNTGGFDAGWDLTLGGFLSPFTEAPQPTQPGPDTIDSAIDLRPTDAVWQGNRLVFVSTFPCGTGPRDCVRVTELNTTGANGSVLPTVTQDFVVGQTGKDLFMGGVGLSGDGTLHIGWTRSSSSDNPSSFAAHQVLGDAANSISSPELLASGSGAYGGERWGDYVGIAQDPQVPNQAWNANEYSGGADWLTKVTPLQTAGATYVPMAPARVLNTRSNVGLSGMFSANKARTWPVAGVAGIPADAVAVTGNVTVTGQTASGFVAITVNPSNSPPTSSINFPKGQTRANNVTIPLSPSGSLSATYGAAAGNKTHVLFDVTGYFLADDSGATFTAISPVRVISTRLGTGLSRTVPQWNPEDARDRGGTSGVPITATAVTGNLTVVKPTRGGYVAITQDPVASPPTSTLNFPTGTTSRANGFFAPLSAGHAVSIVYNVGSGSATADMIMDITGYFVPGTAGLHFFPLNPSRALNTRPTAVLSGLTGKFTANVPRTLDVDGHWGVPVGAEAITANLTVTAQTGSGFVAVTPDPDATPSTSTLNFPVGDTMANGLVGPLNSSGNSSFTYVSGSGKKTDLILDLSGYFE